MKTKPTESPAPSSATAAALAFCYADKPLRTVTTATGDILFVAKDVCGILGIADHRSAVQDLDADEKGVVNIHSPGGDQETNTVTESGLYALIFKSRKPAAKAFRKWITAEVIPSIRRTGGYTAPGSAPAALDAETVIRIATESATAAVARLLESRKAPERRREVIEGAGGVAIIRSRSIRVSITAHTRFHERVGLLRDHGFRYDPARRRWLTRHSPEAHAIALRAIAE